MPAQGYADDAEKDGETGEAVGAGMEAVGHKGGAAYAASDSNAVVGDDFIAQEADGCGDGDSPEVGDMSRVDETVAGLSGAANA